MFALGDAVVRPFVPVSGKENTLEMSEKVANLQKVVMEGDP